ncbi:MAG TPA: hypothetical protein VMS31_04850 [Pyrinomonadaceae bacterium]|nr:hypothetical protein [Pyrinomonadaceae bacterium]
MIGFVNDDPVDTLIGPIDVRCLGKWCKDPFSLSSDKVAYEAKESAEAPATNQDEPTVRAQNTEPPRVSGGVTAKGKNRGGQQPVEKEEVEADSDQDKEEPDKPTKAPITVDKPKPDFPPVKDVGSVDSYLTVAKDSGITQIRYDVTNDKDTFVSDDIDVSYPAGKDAQLNVKVRILKGINTIRFRDATEPGDLKRQAFTVVKCGGDKCATTFDEATIVTNSLNTRAVVGLEQVGASSTDSEMKPFLDFFFTAPIRFKPRTDQLPRISTWGQIRLSATPQEAAAFGVFPSNLANQVATSSNSTGLVQSFDFLAGFEARAFDADKSSPSLIPGIKQQTAFYFTAGGGAISPLSTTKQSAQIWKVPEENSSQRAVFIERFGEEAAKNPYIAFVLPERDRFLRQFYGGIRLKTFFYDRNEQLINRFPGILDVMFGQNEAVTGGSLKHNVKDSTGKIIGRRRSYVFRLDGFYPLPFREASFLYLYGTAMLKLGNGGVRVSTPLFLDHAPPEISVTNKDVFIQRAVQDRDYYKIGVGINLTELFNRKTAQPK